jgi:hypothetical protein
MIPLGGGGISGEQRMMGRGCVVGAAFAVLVAEELFPSGCRFLVSMTSSGQILPVQAPPYFVVIERALRDEGTSYHYLPPSDYSEAAVHLTQRAREALIAAGIPIQSGATWTTDAPFRETEKAIDAAKRPAFLHVGSPSARIAELHSLSSTPASGPQLCGQLLGPLCARSGRTLQVSFEPRADLDVKATAVLYRPSWRSAAEAPA